MLLAAGAPGKRAVLPGARLVLRQPVPAEPVSGRAGDPAVQAQEPTRARRSMEEMPARHTGRSREQVGADIERELVLTAPEAVEYGLADRMVPHREAGPRRGGGEVSPWCRPPSCHRCPH